MYIVNKENDKMKAVVIRNCIWQTYIDGSLLHSHHRRLKKILTD